MKMNPIDANAIIGDRDLSDLGWQRLSDFGWSNLECGHIVCTDRLGEKAIGFVTSKVETINGDYTVHYSLDFSKDNHDAEHSANHEDVWVAPLDAIVWTDRVPTLVKALRFYPNDGLTGEPAFVCDTDDEKLVRVNPYDISFVAADRSTVKLGEHRGGDGLSVSDVSIHPFDGDVGHIKATADVVLNGGLLLKQLRVVEACNGLYVGYPNDPFYNGEGYRSIFFPIIMKVRDRIESAVLDAYRKFTKK